jgi:hypothetical protein
MAINQLKSTNVNGTFSVNDVPVDAASQAAAVGTLNRIALAMVGVDETANGVVGGEYWLKVAAQASPNLTVKIAVGSFFILGVPGSAAAVASLTGFTAPASNPRIDIVEVTAAGVVSRKAGTENASPTAPTVTSGSLKLAEVYNRVGQTLSLIHI